MMRHWLIGVLCAAALGVGLVGAVSAQVPPLGAVAPEISGGPWVNSDPLTLAALRGRVVLVDFWTYG